MVPGESGDAGLSFFFVRSALFRIVLSVGNGWEYVRFMESIPLYQAISEMRKISASGRFFSFSHVSYNKDTRQTSGIREVRRAKLRPAAKGDDIRHSDFKLFYYDDLFHESRVCWQPLLLFFNGKKIILQ